MSLDMLLSQPPMKNSGQAKSEEGTESNNSPAPAREVDPLMVELFDRLKVSPLILLSVLFFFLTRDSPKQMMPKDEAASNDDQEEYMGIIGEI